MKVRIFNSSQLLMVSVLIILLSGVLAARSFYLKDDKNNIFVKRAEYVYELRGELKKPGFYSYYEMQSIQQLINACGSLTGEVSSSGLNKKLKSGTRIILTDKIKIESLDASARINFFLPINVNLASIDDLLLIPGVGRKTAESIVFFRDKNKGINDLNDMVKIKGKFYTKVKSIKKFRQSVGELLAEIMRIKAEGDYEAAKNLVQKYGIYFNKEWRDQMVARYKKIHKGKPIIKNSGYSMPILLPRYNDKGEIIDVKLKYLRDFEKEQLYYSGKIEID